MKTSIIGIGNPLMGDDGIGIVVLEQLRQLQLPEGTELIDGGTGGITLLQLLEECERALIIDAADFGQKPGTILRLAGREAESLHADSDQLSLHQQGLYEVLTLARELGKLPKLILYLVQPLRVERSLELSEPMQPVISLLANQVIEELKSWR